MKATVLLIDDSAENLMVLSELLQPLYRVLAATSGDVGLRLARSLPTPDLILLDVLMPGLDGFAVLARLRDDSLTAAIPVVFLTALTSSEEEERGLRAGAADYITKPPSPAVVLARVRTQLEAKQARDWLQDRNAALAEEVSHRMAENELTQQVTMRALAHLAETRDPETGNHLLRTQGYVQKLATLVRHQPRFAGVLDAAFIDRLVQSAPLHDIGKVGIPDHILLKPGPLTADEWAVMRTHARKGYDALVQAETDVKVPLPFLATAKA